MELHERVDLRAWTALGVGGVAAFVARCHSTSGVREILDLAASHGLGWVNLGGGSRLIPSDRGIAVPVVSLTGELARWETELDGLVAGGGANLAQVCRAARRGGLSGLDAIMAESHSVGGLIRSAAEGIFTLGGILDWIELQRPGAEISRWLGSGTRPVPSPEDLERRVVTRVRFRLRPSGLAQIKLGATVSSRGRAIRSTGPVFLDARDATAADLLAEAGCETVAVGGVRLGGDRGNELIAGRSATSTDVLELCRTARDRVLAVTGITLMPALAFVDELGRKIEL